MRIREKIPKEITKSRRKRVVLSRSIVLMVQDILARERVAILDAITLAASKEEVLYNQFQLKRLRARLVESFDDLQHQCNELSKESAK